jgi:hypothetical protein
MHDLQLTESVLRAASGASDSRAMCGNGIRTVLSRGEPVWKHTQDMEQE